jgi:hypothetical protein
MSATLSLRTTSRFGLLFAGAHFLLVHFLWGVALVLPRHGADFISAALLTVVAVLLAPIALLAPFGRGSGPAFMFPPATILPVAFASAVWAVILYGLFLLLRRFVGWRPSSEFLRLGRRFGLGFALIAITWLFFGPMFGFAGDIMFGVLDPARIMDGRFQYRPLWVGISFLAWAAAVFISYRFLIVAPLHA